MTLPASIRVNVRAPFPSNVRGVGGISINKKGGIWTIGLSLPLPRIVGLAGIVNVLPVDGAILLQKSPSGSSTLNLPLSGDSYVARGGMPLLIKDMTYDAYTNHDTIVPASGETIDGYSASAAAANGLAVIDIDGGFKWLYPLPSGGWYLA